LRPTAAAALVRVSSVTLALSGSGRRWSCGREVATRLAIADFERSWSFRACLSCRARTRFTEAVVASS
jgi:hypothetical protein